MYSFFKFQSLIEPGLVRKGTWREHHILPRVSSPTEGCRTPESCLSPGRMRQPRGLRVCEPVCLQGLKKQNECAPGMTASSTSSMSGFWTQFKVSFGASFFE
ncbi:uncharacterized protein YALI1_B02082g [Yarrowia lipolytica]|uniref:Uncharacterized protein n=1 Tax=Yarrowia lipolytica TaxID=4952 RepID=A0A1D8N622_YARLL|nr:hypothetical protein YALI1_B02082g [Yarrowia lipolytica]